MDTCFLYNSVLKFDPTLEDPTRGADVAVLDLEDSVHASAKGAARRALAAVDLRPHAEKGSRFGVRINSIASIDGLRDLDVVHDACEAGRLAIHYLQLPKVQSRDELALCKSVLASLSRPIKLFPLVETPRGIDVVEELAAESDTMLFGQADITSHMYRPNEAYLGYARGRFCVACARSAIAPIDTRGFENITDMVEFERECLVAKAEGFMGKAVIHPRQVPVVKKVFAIAPEEIEKHRRVIRRYRENTQGFAIEDGQVIAPPFVARAERMLALWGVGATDTRTSTVVQGAPDNG